MKRDELALVKRNKRASESDGFFPRDLPDSVVSEHFVDLVIISRDRSVTVKVSPYECSYGFRRSKFLRQILKSLTPPRRLLLPSCQSPRLRGSYSISLTPSIDDMDDIATVVEDSSCQDIRAALEFIHMGYESLNFTAVPAMKYAKTAEFLMIRALREHLLVLSFTTITGIYVRHIDDMYRHQGEKIEKFPKSNEQGQPAVVITPSQYQMTSWEAYFILRHLGYTSDPEARTRIQLDKWVAFNPTLLRDPRLYEYGHVYFSSKEMAKFVSQHTR
jgi:hypothetical protein